MTDREEIPVSRRDIVVLEVFLYLVAAYCGVSLALIVAGVIVPEHDRWAVAGMLLGTGMWCGFWGWIWGRIRIAMRDRSAP